MLMLAQHFPTAEVVAVSMFIWPIMVMSTPVVMNYSQLLVDRFFLGAV